MPTPIPPTPPEPQNRAPQGTQNWPPPDPPFQYPQPPARQNGFWKHPVILIIMYGLLTTILMIGFTLVVFAAWYVLYPGHFPDISEMKQPLLFVSEIIQALGAFLAFLIMVVAAEGRSLSSAGFSPRRWARETGSGFALGAILMTAVILASAALGVYRASGLDPHFGALIWLGTFLATAIFEETIFRGYVLRVITERWGPAWGLTVSSILFGLIHLGNPTPGATTIEHYVGPVFITFEAGLLMGVLYLLTRRLWLPIGLHWAWNFFEGPIYGSDVSGIHSASLVRAHIQGPFVLTGGVFGPEAGVPCLIICTAVAIALIQKAKRDGKWTASPAVE